MNSISRAVTSKINEFSNKRQRLVTEVGDFGWFLRRAAECFMSLENPSWTDASTSEFNYFDPPNIIIPEQDWRETPILDGDKVSPQAKSPSVKITQKVSSVVRKLSPFSQSPTVLKEQKEIEGNQTAEGSQEQEKKKMFKDTREKVGKLRKSFQSKDKAQLIDSDEDV